jgi:hypothetical protein
MAKRYRASAANVADYWHLFVNRRAYTMQSTKAHEESGRYYYFRPKNGKDGGRATLTESIIAKHLEGDITVGIYAMNPQTQCCKWIALDGDYKDSLKHLCEMQWELRQQHVDAALEQSRRGAHLWIFGAGPLLAKQCRSLVFGVAQKLNIPVKGAGQADGIEVFPKHDELKEGDFGNAVRGPLGIHRAIGARFWFYGADYDLDDQLAFLKSLKKVPAEQLDNLVGKLGPASDQEREKEPRRPTHWHSPGLGRQFRILDHIDVRRKTGRNWIARCPSCAAAGRDRSGDNLAISVDEPMKYICWAGCTKEMIRSCLGYPIPEREGAYASR